MPRSAEHFKELRTIEAELAETDPLSKKIADARRDPSVQTVYLTSWSDTTYTKIEPIISLVYTMLDAQEPDRTKIRPIKKTKAKIGDSYQLVEETTLLHPGHYTKLYFNRESSAQI